MHPGTENGLKWLKPNPRLPDAQMAVASPCHQLAELVVPLCAEGAEFTAGLRKLTEAKDCFVRASIEKRDQIAAEHEARAQSLAAQRQVAD